MPITRDECPRLLSLAVHEFRTPVTVVAGYLRMLMKMPAGVDDQPRKLIEEAEKSCTRLAALLAELGELSNLDAGHLVLDKRDVDFGALLDEVARGVHEGADRGVRLEIEHRDHGLRVQVDPRHLGRALESLLTATLRERAEPGVIVASCGVALDPGDRRAYLTVAPRAEDAASGPFVPDEWGAFEEWRGGVGFRLVLAKEVIAAHGGTVFSGQGGRARARCAVTLPIKES